MQTADQVHIDAQINEAQAWVAELRLAASKSGKGQALGQLRLKAAQAVLLTLMNVKSRQLTAEAEKVPA